MTPCGEKIAGRIGREGPLLFSEFMEMALYDPECGYYTARESGSDPFGKHGDFFTAAQLSPVFGRLMGCLARKLNHTTVVDWGAGRRDLQTQLSGLRYISVDNPHSRAPQLDHALVIANELFDALPVDVARREGGQWRQMRVACGQDAFRFVAAEPLTEEWLEYARDAERCLPEGEPSPQLELPARLTLAMERISAAVQSGHLLALDYGYRHRELIRFPQGTLMGYRKHRASEEVLLEPGLRDITAHVPFDYLERAAAACGWRRTRAESMASLLMFAGEADEFGAALQAATEVEQQRLRLQLKTLLFGMGESFQALLWERATA
jgi:SAM-dependent MidA family methyltransferase